MAPLPSESPGLNVARVCPTNGLLAAGGDDGALECFDLRSPVTATRLPGASAGGGGVTCLRFDDAGMTVRRTVGSCYSPAPCLSRLLLAARCWHSRWHRFALRPPLEPTCAHEGAPLYVGNRMNQPAAELRGRSRAGPHVRHFNGRREVAYWPRRRAASDFKRLSHRKDLVRTEQYAGCRHLLNAYAHRFLSPGTQATARRSRRLSRRQTSTTCAYGLAAVRANALPKRMLGADLTSFLTPGLVLMATEAKRLAPFFMPSLGPAPRCVHACGGVSRKSLTCCSGGAHSWRT